jgi:hypothetical protein
MPSPAAGGIEHCTFLGFRSSLKHILGERDTGFCEQRHDPITMSLGVTHEHLAGTPMDICKLEFSQFPVAKSSGAAGSKTWENKTSEISGPKKTDGKKTSTFRSADLHGNQLGADTL